MNTFLNEEAIATTRKSMTHLQNMKPEVFVKWLKTVKYETKGIISNYKTSLKADGLGYRFGKDESGKIFVEGSRTGIITDSGSFSNFARNNNRSNDIIIRAIHYDAMLELFKSADFMKALPADTKVICEILYNPLASEEANGLTFVSVKYDKNKLGKKMSIVLIDVLYANSGKSREDSEDIKNALYKLSDDEIKIINPKLKMGSIDVNAIIDPVAILDDSALLTLKSRKAVDKEAKENILSIIQKTKDELTEYLLKHPDIENKFLLGPELEGIVMDIPDVGTFKVVDPAFKMSKSYPIKAKKEVELFLGRLQPPHLGHKKNIDAMKNPVIGIVRGTKSGLDKTRNPLEVDYQISLIKKFAPNAIIKVFPDGFLPFIISSLRQEGLEVVTILAGSDRIDSYKQSIVSFNKKLPDDRKIEAEFKEIARDDKDISATKIRSAIRTGDKEFYQDNVPKELWGEFEKLQSLMKESYLSFSDWLLQEDGEIAMDNTTNSTGNLEVAIEPINKKTIRRKRRKSFLHFMNKT
jgi:hypothetical protein